MLMFVMSPSLRDATAVLPSRLGTGFPRGHLSYGAIQWPGCSCSVDTALSVCLCFALCFSASLHRSPVLPFFYFMPLSLPPPPSPIVCLTYYLLLSRLRPFFWGLSSSIRPSTSLSHTLVATLKTVVTMVTAMCCGNVKELHPPRITSLFNTEMLDF